MDASSRNGVNARVSGLPIPLGLMSDDRLARLVQSGSERAFAMIYERYNQRLYRYTCSILHDGEDARDALQSTLAHAFAALQRGKPDAPLCPWLFRIAHNEAISIVRRRAAVYDMKAPELCVPSAEEIAGERTRLAALVADLRGQALDPRRASLTRGIRRGEADVLPGRAAHDLQRRQAHASPTARASPLARLHGVRGDCRGHPEAKRRSARPVPRAVARPRREPARASARQRNDPRPAGRRRSRRPVLQDGRCDAGGEDAHRGLDRGSYGSGRVGCAGAGEGRCPHAGHRANAAHDACPR